MEHVRSRNDSRRRWPGKAAAGAGAAFRHRAQVEDHFREQRLRDHRGRGGHLHRRGEEPQHGQPEGAFKDSGSLVNGTALAGCTAPTSEGWSLPSGYPYPKTAASQVKASVLANAGTGRI